MSKHYIVFYRISGWPWYMADNGGMIAHFQNKVTARLFADYFRKRYDKAEVIVKEVELPK